MVIGLRQIRATIDVVISEYGASIWSDPYKWVLRLQLRHTRMGAPLAVGRGLEGEEGALACGDLIDFQDRLRLETSQPVPRDVDQVRGNVLPLGFAFIEPPLPHERDHPHQCL
ncbi:hypothetical protein BH20ACT23_BH20ACT23_17130 [soil metagenome]